MPVTCQSTVQTGQYVIAYNDPRHLNESIYPTVLQCPIHMLFCQDISMRGFAQGQLWTTNPTQLFEHRWCPASSFPDRLDFQGGEPFGLKSIRLLNSNCSSVSTSEWAFYDTNRGCFFIFTALLPGTYIHTIQLHYGLFPMIGWLKCHKQGHQRQKIWDHRWVLWLFDSFIPKVKHQTVKNQSRRKNQFSVFKQIDRS